MTNIEKLARLICRLGNEDRTMKALDIALKVEMNGDNVRTERPELGVRQVAAGFDPTGILKQVG